MLKGLLKKFLIITVMLVMLSFGFFKVSFVKAQPLADPAAYLAIMTTDQPTLWATIGQTAKDIASWAKDMAYQEWEWIRDEGIALAYKKALNYFLKTLAYDAATYLVTGDKGQGSMFYTESFGDYLANVGDNAAGHFLETLGAEGPVKFDLCHPGENMVQIGLGIMKTKRPDAPDCSYSEMRNNWETELNRPDFMSRFVKIYDVESNDFGVALSLQSDMIQSEEFAEKVAELERTTNQGFKDVTDKISGAIKTPSDAVRSYMDDVIEKSGEGYLTYTGHALADAIDVFTNTLIGKLLEEWLKKGLSRSHDDTSYAGDWGASGSFGGSGGSGGSSGGGSGGGSGGSSGASYAGSGGLTNYEENTSASGGIVKAQKQFETLIAPSFAVKGDYEVLNDLVSCGKPTEADVDECVITDSFRQAVDKKLSVVDAVNQGFLSKSGTFGFKGDGVEPSYSEGFPYRSMLILRKYRIIPVGWELAAQYISEHQSGQNGLNRSFNLGDMIACFDANDRYAGYYSDWCEGLVDPAWVLKAPLNFCKREGPGPYIQSKNVVGNNTDSRYVISRDTSYCADEQTCVKEKKDGSCEVYGYCVEDRRKYNFDGESCDPNYNTCQTFRAGDGRTLSLLENTLDYSGCDADNAGCEYYDLPETAEYVALTNKVNYDGGDKISLDASASACEAGSEGCHEFIRMKPGMGTNILTNSSFESEDFLADWDPALGSLDSDSKEGFNAVLLGRDINRSVVINQPNATWPAFSLAGSVYTLSFYARNCPDGAEIHLGTAAVNTSQQIPEGNEWRFIAVSHTYPEGSDNSVSFWTSGAVGADPACVVDAFKLERSLPEADGVPTQYVPYRGVGIVYEKLLPDYLYDSCYTVPDSSGFIQKRGDAPAICDDYARPCTATEVDCSLYSSQTEDFQVPAVVGATDYCPADCVGYDNYQQSETNFEEQKEAHLIPSQAKQCTLMAKGCDAFTNLDETTGAEKREYFVNLRSCVAPTEPSCQTFFMWEGSDESGYQLKVHKLDAPGGVIRTRTPGSSCSVDLADIGDPNTPYHPDCREFYDLNGYPQYAVYYDTFSCTDDCHPYRRAVMSNVLADEEDDCIYGGGTWTDGAYCVYMGVPQENITCSAEDAGCREYSGNAGANERVVFEHSFENGTNMGWVGGVPSTDSVIVGQHSMSIADEATLVLGGEVVRNRSYVLEFLATTNGGAATIDIDIVNPNPVDGEEGSYSFASDLSLTDRWQSYQVNLPSLGHTVDQIGEHLRISGNIYIDNIRLIEVIDRHYLIKDSWDNKCDFIDLNPTNIDATNLVPGHYAGCDAYLDADKKTHNLFQFNHLCSEDAVGCEMMIDTHNSTDYAQAIYNEVDPADGACNPATEPDCELVPHDSFTFAVFDKTKSCALQEKGCERLGLRYEYSYGNTPPYNYQYFDNYRLNDPDKYAQSLCRTSEARCDAWTSRNGQSYFKDPNDMICEWRLTSEGGIGNWDWYKKKVKRCDADDDGIIDVTGTDPSNFQTALTERNLCQTAADCDPDINVSATVPDSCEDDEDCNGSTCVNGTCHHSCILDENDYACQTDNTANIPPKTAGTGGQGGAVRQPLVPTPPATGVYWAGACPGNQDDCTEYIDPDSWSSPQVDTLEPHTLYVLVSGTLPLADCPGGTRYFRLNIATNRFESVNILNVPGLYYYVNDSLNYPNCSFNPANTKVRKAIVDYQLDYTLNKSACNGMVDLDKGCQLFNERKKDGADYSSFTYLANRAIYMNGPISPQSGTGNDSNLILKVTPDRDCNKWLSCRSFIKDSEGNDVCFDVGLCDRFDANGNCSSFIPKDTTPVNQVFDNIITTNPPTTVNQSDISNRTGYSLLSYGAYSGKAIRSDYFPVSDMKQVGQTAIIGNAGFEMFGADLYPIGWMSGDNNSNSGWTRDKFKVINDPVTAQKENITYPMDGVSFLKFGAVSTVFSEPFEIVGGQNYILTYWINTKNLAAGSAQVSVVSGGGTHSFPTSRGESWRKEVREVNIGGGMQSARIRLETVGGGRSGNVFIDNISLKPALHSRDNSPGNEWYTTQDCRLFPENSSLGCDYYGEGSHRKTGWYGYCLQYDRYPGDPKACLQWYPIDRVNGDGFEEGGGYIDRDPLYYCTATSELRYGQNGANITPLVPTQTPTDVEEFVRQNNFGAQQSGDIDITINRSSSDDGDNWTLEQLGLGEVDAKWLEWENIDHIRVRHSSPSVMCCDQISPAWDNYYRFTQASQGTDCSQGDFDCIPWGIYPNYQNSQADSDFFGDHCHNDSPIPREGGIRMLTENGKFVGIKTSTSDTRCDHPDMQLLEVVIFPKIDFCSEVVQAVTPTGYNKYYSNHVYEGSNYQFNCNGGIEAAEDSVCVYSSDLAPFGAVAQPGLANNDQALQAHPYMWDSKEGTKDNQPLFYELKSSSMFSTGQARMGQYVPRGSVTGGLFAQYFGRWVWRSDTSAPLGVRQITGNYRYEEGPNAVSGGGINPRITRISNNGTGMANVNVNSLMKLTFNTDIDPAHLPMTMLSVNWGDGSFTTISGMEMRDRPEASNPHIMYHIYEAPRSATISITVRDNWGRSSTVSSGSFDVESVW